MHPGPAFHQNRAQARLRQMPQNRMQIETAGLLRHPDHLGSGGHQPCLPARIGTFPAKKHGFCR